MVLFARLLGVKKVRGIRMNRKCKDVGGIKGNLFDVLTHQGTYRNQLFS